MPELSRNRVLVPIFAVVFLLAACGGPEQASPEAVVDPPVEEAQPQVDESQPDAAPVEDALEEAPPAVEDPPAEAGARPAWHSMVLTDVRKGQTFTVADLEGKVVVMEAMAVWCPSCLAQQREINASLQNFGDEVVAISLDIDPTETAEYLARHAEANGFTWLHVVSNPGLSAILQQEFGPQVLAPTATPIILIAPDGTTELTPFGIKSADILTANIQALLP